jgi:hypothetical protein
LQTDRLRKIWTSNCRRTGCGRVVRRRSRKLGIESRRRILRTIRAAGNHKLALHESLFFRPARRLIGHDLRRRAADSLRTRRGSSKRVCVIRGRLAKAGNAEDNGCDDECRDEQPTSYHRFRKRHKKARLRLGVNGCRYAINFSVRLRGRATASYQCLATIGEGWNRCDLRRTMHRRS